MLVEQLAGMPMEAYLQREFYEPMGLEHTGYLPLRRFAKSEIVPSNKDRFLRKERLCWDLYMMRLPLSLADWLEMPDFSLLPVM